MAEQKTKETGQAVTEFLDAIPDEQRRQDCYTLMEMMRKLTGYEPKMWGPSIIGFGKYHYKYASGHEGDSAITGFSPRKEAITIYLTYGFENYPDLMERLGKHKVGKGCLYIKRLSDVDPAVLEELIRKMVVEPRS
jgi:hypothetical protein